MSSLSPSERSPRRRRRPRVVDWQARAALPPPSPCLHNGHRSTLSSTDSLTAASPDDTPQLPLLPAAIHCDSPPRLASSIGCSTAVMPPSVLLPPHNSLQQGEPTTTPTPKLFSPETATVVVDHEDEDVVHGQQPSETAMCRSMVGLKVGLRHTEVPVRSHRSASYNSLDTESADLERMGSYVLPRNPPQGELAEPNQREMAAQRFLLAQQMRRISMHRADRERELAEQNTARRLSSVQAVLQGQPILGPHTDVAAEEKAAFERQMTSDSALDENLDPFCDQHARQQRAFERKLQILDRRHQQRLVRTTPPAVAEKSKRSNRVLIRNALQFVCLAGGATDLERISAMNELQRCHADWFIVLLRKNMHKFRALYSVHDDVAEKIYGDGPAQIDSSMVATVYKYNSAGKCFEVIHARGLTAATDAVSLKPSSHRRFRVLHQN